MDYILYIVLTILSVFVGITLVRDIIPFIVKGIRIVLSETQPFIKRMIKTSDEFFSSEHPGKCFVKLLNYGKFRTIKTNNHGANFPDNRQFNTFKKYLTEDVCNAVNRIGDEI